MDNKTVWFPADRSLSSGSFSLPCSVILTSCYKCGRKFVVSSLVNGTPHDLGSSVCFTPNPLSESKYLKQMKEIENWLKEV